MEKITDDQESEYRPTPDDFDNYLPWACNQLQLDSTILITKVFQNEYLSATLTDRSKKVKSRAKLTQSRHDVSDQERSEKSISGQPQLVPSRKTVRIITVYDVTDNLTEIKFIKNIQIPRQIIKIIGMIIKFQPHVTKFVINGGMNMYTIYELNKFLNNSNITEIYLDDSFLKEANYDLLLDSTNLQHLSLSRCKIDDVVVKNIAKKLTYPTIASKALIVLNLSSNSITDEGADYLAQALRSNRKLGYLNIADNRLTDSGASHLLDVLTEFPITSEELLESRKRHMLYLKHKSELVDQVIKELKESEFEKKTPRRITRPVSVALKKEKLDKDSSLKSLGDAISLANMDYLYHDKALTIVENRLGEFKDPYNKGDIIVKDGWVYSKGNNILSYLNLAYNNLSYLSIKKILSVLVFQKLLDRQPRGLINLVIDGNNLPLSCKEMVQIDDILDMGLMVHNRRLSSSKKRSQSKTTSH